MFLTNVWKCFNVENLLSQEYPKFSEEELYQTGRLIVAGLIARIHTIEWTPALLNNKVLNISMHNNWCARMHTARRMSYCMHAVTSHMTSE